MQSLAEVSAGTSRGALRRAAIVEAATTVFLEKGYAGASLDRVIERSGGSRRTLYEQFGNKDGLFVAVVEGLPGHVLTLDPLPPSETAAEDLARTGAACLAMLFSDRVIAACRLVLAEIVRFPDLAARFMEACQGRARTVLAERLVAQARAGRIALDDPERTAALLLGMMTAEWQLRALCDAHVRPDPATLDARAREAVRIFLGGVARGDDRPEAAGRSS